jgi:hypothetical protein
MLIPVTLTFLPVQYFVKIVQEINGVLRQFPRTEVLSPHEYFPALLYLYLFPHPALAHAVSTPLSEASLSVHRVLELGDGRWL